MKISEINNNATHQIDKGLFGGIRKKNKGYSLSLQVNGQSGQTTVKIIDNKSREVISEPSSQSLRDLNDQIYDMAGRLLDKKFSK